VVLAVVSDVVPADVEGIVHQPRTLYNGAPVQAALIQITVRQCLSVKRISLLPRDEANERLRLARSLCRQAEIAARSLAALVTRLEARTPQLNRAERETRQRTAPFGCFRCGP
jgi:hypothetical protein